jgi:hypothetical protein
MPDFARRSERLRIGCETDDPHSYHRGVWAMFDQMLVDVTLGDGAFFGGAVVALFLILTMAIFRPHRIDSKK